MMRGQSTLEYAVLVGVVAAAFIAMQVYARRAIQANFKTLEDSLRTETTLRR